MKKFLSLVLALIMTMSLVTVSAGAKDFTDDDKLNYEEAVAVMSEIGVIDGYTDGSFKPQNGLTRGAAAKIICNMILGPTTAAALRADTAPFKDVPADNQYAGYIAYCVQQGITAGYTDGTYRPAAPLTSFAFMKMLLGALGYDAVAEGYVGGNCFINVAKQAIGIGLNKSLLEEFDGGKQITREEAALFAFNTLKATMVEYDAKTVVSAGGVEVTLSGNLKDVSWTGYNNADGNIKDDGKVQFAEKYFSKLVGDPDIDDFGRPSTTWSYNKKNVGTYVNRDLLVATYTTDVEGGEVWSDIGSVAAKFDLTFYVDGDELTAAQTKDEAAQLVKKNEDSVGENATDAVVGNGVLTEVYVDVDAEELTIVQVHTWLAEVVADYNAKSETLTIDVFDGVDPAAKAGEEPKTLSTTKKISVEDIPGIEDYEEDDMVLVTIASGDVKTIVPVETVSDVSITSYSTDYKTNAQEQVYALTKLTADGEKYETAGTAYESAKYLWDYAVEQLKDATYNLYLDPYGYVIGVRAVSETKNYMFVVGYEVTSTYLASAIDEALVIFTDGTMETIKVKDNKLTDEDQAAMNLNGRGNANVNKWFTYTESDGVYTLKELVKEQIADSTTYEISKTSTTVQETVGQAPNAKTTIAYGNANSTYISVGIADDVVDAGSIVKVDSVSTGIKKTSIQLKDSEKLTNFDKNDSKIFAMYNGDGYVTYAVVVGKSAGVSENLVFLTSGIKAKNLVDGEYQYTYNAIMKGEETSVQSFEAADTANKKLTADTLYKATFDSDGIITEMEKLVETPDGKLTTAQYKTDGYALRIIDKSVDTDKDGVIEDGETNNAKELTLKGMTLWIDDENTNDQYILLDDECNIFVKDSADGKWAEYTNARSALNALGEDTMFTGVIAAICDEGGVATTLILVDTNVFNDIQATVKPEETPAAGLKTISYAADKLTATMTGKAAKDTTYTVTLSAMQSGAMYEIGTYKITVLKDAESGFVATTLPAGDYKWTCGTSFGFFTVAAG